LYFDFSPFKLKPTIPEVKIELALRGPFVSELGNNSEADLSVSLTKKLVSKSMHTIREVASLY